MDTRIAIALISASLALPSSAQTVKSAPLRNPGSVTITATRPSGTSSEMKINVFPQLTPVYAGEDTDLMVLLKARSLPSDDATVQRIRAINGDVAGKTVSKGQVFFVPTFVDSSGKSVAQSSALTSIENASISRIKVAFLESHLDNVSKGSLATLNTVPASNTLAVLRDSVADLSSLKSSNVDLTAPELAQLETRTAIISNLAAKAATSDATSTRYMKALRLEAKSLQDSASGARKATSKDDFFGKLVEVSVVSSEGKPSLGKRVFAVPAALARDPKEYGRDLISRAVEGAAFARLSSPTTTRLMYGRYFLYVTGGISDEASASRGMIENIWTSNVETHGHFIEIRPIPDKLVKVDIKE